MTRLNQRSAICMAFGWDYADLTAYQPSVWRGTTKVYDCGNGYVVAVKQGVSVPKRLSAEFGAWKLTDTFQGWTVYTAGNV